MNGDAGLEIKQTSPGRPDNEEAQLVFTLMGNLSSGPAGAAVGQNDSENLVSKNSPSLAVALN